MPRPSVRARGFRLLRQRRAVRARQRAGITGRQLRQRAGLECLARYGPCPRLAVGQQLAQVDDIHVGGVPALGHALGRVDDPHQTPGNFGYGIGLVGGGEIPVWLDVGKEQRRVLAHIERRQLGLGGRWWGRRYAFLASAGESEKRKDCVGSGAHTVWPSG
jgi:hypothetical protein